MLLEVIAVLAGLLVATVLFDVAKTMVLTRLAVAKFKKGSNGLPICDRLGPFGHLDWVYAGDIWKLSMEEHRAVGKFLAFFYADQVGVSTIDIDFIKSMIFDEPQHTNRIGKLDFPIKEFTPDSILFAVDDQWRKLRKYTAPAFS